MSLLKTGLVWVDLEMTGLEIEKDKIMEIAVIVTDADLNVVASLADSIVIHLDEESLAAMNAWCQEHHGKSGLTERSRKSTVSLAEAEETVLSFVKQHVAERSAPLAGNSVYMDRLFLKKYMPRFDDYLHYRIVDVSTVKELCRRWYPVELEGALKAKTGSHRALDDIKESIGELQYYRKHVFKQPQPQQQQ